MLHSARTLRRYEVHATDGKIGKAFDAYIDAAVNAIKYLVVETGRWLPDKKLLIPVERLGLPDVSANNWPIYLTREEAQCCQSEQELPVSWRLEELLTMRYGGLDTRGGAPVSAVHGTVSRQALAQAIARGEIEEESEGRISLRSMREILGYQIEAIDGPLGVAEDFLIDDENWEIIYVVVDTKSWKPGRQVLVPPQWLEEVSWGERRIHLRMSREKVKTSQRADTGSHPSAR